MRVLRLLFPLCLLGLACTSDGLGPVTPGRYASVTGGFLYSCGFTTEGVGTCWGDNATGQGGNGVVSTIDSAPTPIHGLLVFKQIDAGVGHTCGLVPDGRAYCWGVSNDGALGSDTTTQSALPTPVAGGLTFKEISAGDNATCALTTAGVAYCWGANDFGQLGRVSASTQTPVAVETNLKFTKIAVGQYYACAIAVGGAAYCWGSNTYGNLGTTDTTTHAGPRLVAGGLHFKSIAAASFHSCAVTTSSDAYCWGAGILGILGNGSRDNQPTPVLVSGSHQFVDISVGVNHSCGLATGGQLFCWGSNEAAQLAGSSTESCTNNGIDFFSCTSTPIAAAASHEFRSISAGAFHTCAIASAGGAFCWGGNSRGAIGNGVTGGMVGAPFQVPEPPSID